MTESETGWLDELPTVNGWYWSRRSDPRSPLLARDGSVAYGSMWLNPASSPSFFENRKWLGPISASDAEQLHELRRQKTEWWDDVIGMVESVNPALTFGSASGAVMKQAILSALKTSRSIEAARAVLNPKPEKETQCS